MHSSTVRTIRSNSRLLGGEGGVCPGNNVMQIYLLHAYSTQRLASLLDTAISLLGYLNSKSQLLAKFSFTSVRTDNKIKSWDMIIGLFSTEHQNQQKQVDKIQSCDKQVNQDDR